MATLEELEETAKLWLLSGKGADALPEAALSELRNTFGASPTTSDGRPVTHRHVRLPRTAQWTRHAKAIPAATGESATA